MKKKRPLRYNSSELFLNDTIKVISFSAIGVLVEYPMVSYGEIINLLEKKARYLLRDNAFPFVEARLDAERKILSACPTNASDLDAIYAYLASRGILPEECARKLLDAEIHLNIKYLKARKPSRALFQSALSSGKRIITIDDTFLNPDLVRQSLSAQGYEGIHAIYTSSPGRGCKANGSLYKTALEDLQLPPRNLLHVGVDEAADLHAPSKLGISCALGQSSFDHFKSHTSSYGLWSKRNLINRVDPAFRSMIGLSATTVFDRPAERREDVSNVFRGDPYVLGYHAVGPFLLNLVKWITSRAKRNKNDVVAFVARDGFLVQKAYDMISEIFDDAPASLYIRISRSTCLPFDLNSSASVIFNHKILNISQDITVRDALKIRFDVTADGNIEAFFNSRGQCLDQKLGDSPQAFEIMSSEEVGALKSIKAKQIRLSEYYQQELGHFSRVGLFDVGYNARSQRTIEKIIDKPLNGYYISSFHPVVEMEESGFDISNFLNPPQNRWVSNPGFATAVLELILSEFSVGTIVDVDQQNGKWLPVLEKHSIASETEKLLTTIQCGALDFIQNAKNTFGDDLKLMPISANTSFFLLNSFMTNPSPKDAALFQGVNFSNSVMGKEFFLIGRTLRESHWREGFAAIQRARRKKSWREKILSVLPQR